MYQVGEVFTKCYTLGMTQLDLEREVLQLPLKARADLAKKLLESIDEITEPELEELWLEEVGERIEKVQRGESQLIPYAEALRRARLVLTEVNAQR